MGKRVMSVLLTLVFLITILPLSVFAEDGSTDNGASDAQVITEDEALTSENGSSTAPGSIEETIAEVPENAGVEASVTPVEYAAGPEITVIPGCLVPDNLFAGYVSHLFPEGTAVFCDEDTVANVPAYSSSYAGNSLTGQNAIIYNALKTQIADVAAGTSTSTEFTVSVEAILEGKLSADDLGVDASEDPSVLYDVFTFDTNLIVNTLLEDCPYELYWYDKATGTKCIYPVASSVGFSPESVFTFSFSVSADYSAGTSYTTDPSQIQRAQTAAATVDQIVATAASATYTDYDKLVYYREQVCSLATYNASAVGSSDYGDYWQLIHIFDGDSDTCVGYGGYARAFQYLCERTTFSGNVYSILAFGTLNGSEHMWNVVHMDNGCNYLVDLTNCDSGAKGYPDQLFLKGAASGSVSKGYVFSIGSSSFTYQYGQETLDTCAETDLALSAKDYAASMLLADSVTISLSAPSAGNSLPVDTVCGSDAYTVKNIRWLDADGNEFSGTAACSSTYTLQVTLQTAEGYTFGSGCVPITLNYSDGKTTSLSVTSFGSVLSFTDSCTLSHNLTHIAAKASTPSTAGNIEYYTCKGCGKYYSDANGQKELTLDDILLDKPTLQTPVLVSVRLGADGVALTWNSCEYATSYRIYRKKGSGSWVSLASCDASAESTVTFIDTSSLDTGTGYSYTVRALCDDVMSDYNHTGLSITYIAAPVLVSASNVATGVLVKWNAVSDASQYAVYRKTAGDAGWTALTRSVTSTSYTDTTVSSGTEYTYTVIAVVNGAYGCFSSTGVQVYYLAAPTVQKLANHYSTGIDITWKAEDGADIYYVYRKTASSGWALLGSTVYCNYYDSSAVSGETYTYTLRARNSSAGVLSYYNSGLSLLCLYSPRISVISNSTDGLSLRWTSVTGATAYKIYRKDASGRWVSLVQSASTSYVDTNTVSGETYIYTAVAIGNGASSSFDRSGTSQVRLTNPSVSVRNRSDSSNGILVSWSAITGADKYRVYRKTSSGGWQTLVKSTTDLSYLDSSVSDGTTYTYTVRAISSSGALSYFTASSAILRLTQPKLNSVTSSGTALNVSWKAVSGATGYIVYRRANGGAWSSIASITSCSYTDSSVQTSVLYSYTVKAVNGSSQSDYDHTGANGVLLATPSLTSAVNRISGIEFNWTAVENADRYYVYRKSGSSGWTRIGISTVSQYLDENVTEGTVYTYTVRAANDASGVLSSYDSNGVSMMRLAQPTLQASASSKSIDLSWTSVAYAKQYTLYRKDAGASSWTALANVTTTSYSDTSAVAGKTYTYTVRAVNGSYKGEYDHTGVPCTR